MKKADENLPAQKLVIVESPSKAVTIGKYLGSDYIVTSCKGHIRDLKTTGSGGFGVDINDGFTPHYAVLPNKKMVVKELKALAKNAEKVYLATDCDREGEAISWHLYDELRLKDKDYERIVFNEITKKVILEAMNNGREIDCNLVYSQRSRQIIDRIIGFSLSGLLRKKIGSPAAGRVQSVVLKLICEREKEIEDFHPEEYWEIKVVFDKDGKPLEAKLLSFRGEKIKPTREAEADDILAKLTGPFTVKETIKKERKKNPKPPFITSTLQQEASGKLGFMPKKTMSIAQSLYEGVELAKERTGLITYMRTDSDRLSGEFVAVAKQFIEEKYGKDYYRGLHAFPKGKNVQDAHEAIRPVRVENTPESVREYLDPDAFKLYDLIYRRALASMMAPAIIEDQKTIIENNGFCNNGFCFELTGGKQLYDGYLRIYADTEEISKPLPDFIDGEILSHTKTEKERKFTKPPLRYSEGRIIRKMEELGIGRPSTYAPTVEKLKEHNYVKSEKRTLFPTDRGMLTCDRLNKHFASLINVGYTAAMEEILDQIAEGKKAWNEETEKFYQNYLPLLQEAKEKMEQIYPRELDETCPLCGARLVVRNGRYGEFIGCSAYPTCNYIKKTGPISTGIRCPNCGKGYIVERIQRKGPRKGRKFYACDQYPECKTIFSDLSEIGKGKGSEE